MTSPSWCSRQTTSVFLLAYLPFCCHTSSSGSLLRVRNLNQLQQNLNRQATSSNRGLARSFTFDASQIKNQMSVHHKWHEEYEANHPLPPPPLHSLSEFIVFNAVCLLQRWR